MSGSQHRERRVVTDSVVRLHLIETFKGTGENNSLTFWRCIPFKNSFFSAHSHPKLLTRSRTRKYTHIRSCTGMQAGAHTHTCSKYAPSRNGEIAILIPFLQILFHIWNMKSSSAPRTPPPPLSPSSCDILIGASGDSRSDVALATSLAGFIHSL